MSIVENPPALVHNEPFTFTHSNGGTVIVDAEYAWLACIAKWSTDRLGYVRANLSLRRLVMRAKIGELVSHANHNFLDLRKSQLKFCTVAELAIRKRKQKSHSGGECSSRFKGVTKFNGMWHAKVTLDGALTGVGIFADEKEAAMAYDAAMIVRYGDAADTNASLGLFGGEGPRTPPVSSHDFVFNLKGGRRVILDAEDAYLADLVQWRIHHEKDVCGTVYLHRFIKRSGKLKTDHIHGDKLDNRSSKLRVCTQLQNSRNRRKTIKTVGETSSRFKGVCFEKDKKRWVAYIYINRKMKKLGRHSTEDAAARAYDLAAVEHFGEFARTNVSLGLF